MHWNEDVQYIFVNHRAVHKQLTDWSPFDLHVLVNQLLQPTEKNVITKHSLGECSAQYPCYVLQIDCPDDDVDFYDDGHGCVARFRSFRAVRSAVTTCLGGNEKLLPTTPEHESAQQPSFLSGTMWGNDSLINATDSVSNANNNSVQEAVLGPPVVSVFAERKRPLRVKEEDTKRQKNEQQFASANSGALASQQHVRICPWNPFRNESRNVTRNNLQEAKFIGQLDKKYLLYRSGTTLLCVDQHAADERIQLELIQTTKRLEVRASSCPVWLSSCDAQNLRMYKEDIKKWGFEWEELSVSARDKCGLQCVRLTQLPVCDTELVTKEDFVEYIHYLSAAYRPTVLRYPPCISRIQASHACKSAIKFGDKVPQKHAEILLSSLARTKYAFQCAHGRPTVLPLCDTQEIGANVE